MSNALVNVRFIVDVPEEKLTELVGRDDDGTDEWYEASGTAAEEYVRDNLMDAIERYGQTYEPEVEVSS